MKLLIFHIGKDRYGIRLNDIARVLPLQQLKALPLAPAYVAGLMNFHGASVPVLDLCQLAGLQAGGQYFDSRIILVDCPAPDGTSHPLGLMAEHVMGIETVAPNQFVESGVKAAPFLGQIVSSAAGILQMVELGQLLQDNVRAMLFQPANQAA
jgi:chemotaxis-related protein WspB